MEHLLKISEFSVLSGIKRKNLIFYNEIGLLCPEQVGENGYRFYSHRQLETVTVISALQEVGMPLREIKRHLDERTPDRLIELFTIQRKNVEEKIHRLQRIETMIDTRLGITRRALEINPSRIELLKCAEELLFAGDEITCQNTEEIEKAIVEFYNICDEEKIIYGYPFGTIISKKHLLEGNSSLPSHFFFKMPKMEGSRQKLSKPAGLYITGFEHAFNQGSPQLYKQLFDYIKEHGLTIVGNSYEEFLLDEIAVKNPDGYLLQVSIHVETA